jgi:hypothetical protein
MKKQLVFALCLLLVVIFVTACDTAQSAPTAPVPTPAKGQEIAQALPSDTPTLQATATIASTATSTLTLTPSAIPSATATKPPSLTPTPKWQTTQLMPDGSRLPAFKGKVVSFQNGSLKIEVEPGKAFEMSVGNTTNVYAGASGMDLVLNASQTLAFTSAVKETALATIAYRDSAPTVAAIVMLSLSKESAASIPTVPPATWVAIANATRAYATPTATPAGFQATSTPVLDHRIAEFPWGKVDLDIPTEQANEYARANWCSQAAEWVPPEKFSMWATNPNGMIMGAMGGGYFHNVEILSRDNIWKSTPNGGRYFQAIGLIRNTQDRNDSRKILLTIYEGAPIEVFVPVDERMMGGFGTKKTEDGDRVQNVIYSNQLAPTTFSITDINQIRVGQIFGIFERADLFHHPSRTLITEFSIPKSDPWIFQPGAYSASPIHALVFYTQAADPLSTCDRRIKDLGATFSNDWRW